MVFIFRKFGVIAAMILIIIVILFTGFNSGCKGPEGYEPHFDSLYPPPDAPQLLSPPNDTVIWYESPFPHEVVLNWTSIKDVEYYQLQIVNDTTAFPHTNPIQVLTEEYNYVLIKGGKYYWRVRAYNRSWTWYTDWSEIFKFEAYYAP